MIMGEVRSLLRHIPKVDEVLMDERLLFFYKDTPRNVIVDSVREKLDSIREEILEGKLTEISDKDELISDIVSSITEKKKKNLRRVINATGVVLHTNLGRAELSKAAAAAVAEVADSYSTLEYDLKRGQRGSRQDIVEAAVRKVTGAEAAMVVNNNAAATMIVLAAMARGKEVVVSRGELVEIGGSFRIPDVMSESGAFLKEVGTTNKTKPSDYENAYNEEMTGAFMKVHTSNYRIVGFTEDVSLPDMVELGKKFRVPVIYDMGNGLMTDLHRYGVNEPTVKDAVAAGPDVILFSGDKLLGGPQAGIIIGSKKYIDFMKKHPLARAFRVDKMTLAALETTFYQYQDEDKAMKDIPVLRMISSTEEELSEKAKELMAKLCEAVPSFSYEVEKCLDQVGGGSAPTNYLKGCAVALYKDGIPAEKVERLLRKAEIPVVARINHDRVLIDVRTVNEDEFDEVISAVKFVEKTIGGKEGEH